MSKLPREYANNADQELLDDPSASPIPVHILPGTADSSTDKPTAETSNPVANWAWVPIRSLTQRHRSRFLQHLLSLDAHDRYLRFGHPATDSQITKYADSLDFERDQVFGIFNRKLELVAAAHLAYSREPRSPDQPAMAEFGVSVLPGVRGHRFGSRLFDHAVLHARNRRFDTMFIHALSENTAMLRIARRAGAQVVRDGSESEAWLELPRETAASRFDEVVGSHAAEFDYHLKLQANRVHKVWGALTDVRGPFACKSADQ